MKKIIICGRSSDICTMDIMKEYFEDDGMFTVSIPRLDLGIIDAYVYYIDEIMDADMVVVLPMLRNKKSRHHFFTDSDSIDEVEKVISRYSFCLDDITTFKLCLALKFKKPVLLVSTNTFADNRKDWLDSIYCTIKYETGDII